MQQCDSTMFVAKLYGFVLVIIIRESKEVRFNRTITAVGFPYYSVIMSLGTCSENILFWNQEVWGAVRLNRIMDIYYKSSNEEYTVSKVEIKLIINNTDFSAYSAQGVGYNVFSGTLFLPVHVGVTFYSLTIFTCSHPVTEELVKRVDNSFNLSQLPFGKYIQKQLPFY